MAGELKVGRWVWLGNRAECGTTVMRGLLRSSHVGTWPLVTTYTLRTHGACIHTLLRE
jgi:hypothetical protein